MPHCLNYWPMITKLRDWWKQQQDRRFLKRHGCNDWKEYNRWYDPDIYRRCTVINDFYHGYPYVYCFENREHQIYWWDLGYDGSYDVVEWCEQYCKDKFRFDCHRVIKYTNDKWTMNDIGGGDYFFAAFKNEQDFLMFCLRWS